MPSRSHPKLLIASEFPPNASGGGPAVVRQMLREWPEKNLFWWSCLPEPGTRFGQMVARQACATIPRKLLPLRRFSAVKSWLLDRGWAPFAAAHLKRMIRSVRPDVVWAIPHNWAILPLAAVLREGSAGFHVTMQDYVDVHGQVERFGPARCRRMAHLADILYATATTRDATSHPMVADLQARTGAAAAQMLHAGVEEEDFRALAMRTESSSGHMHIAHAGTILAPKEFAIFAEAVAKLRAELPQPVTLHLFGSHSYAGASWFDPVWMRERGNLAESELLAALRECTWGFSPMALTDDTPRYNRFSFPTKFITYLAAGLPVITLGHPQCSVMQMAAQYTVGPTSCAPDALTLAEQLRSPLSDPLPRSRYASEILRCARGEFGAAHMRGKLYQCFARCAEVTRERRP